MARKVGMTCALPDGWLKEGAFAGKTKTMWKYFFFHEKQNSHGNELQSIPFGKATLI